MSPSAAVGVLHCSSNASSVVGLACHARRSHSRRCRYSAILQNGLTEESRNRYYAFLKSKNRSKAAVDKVCETEYLPFQVCQEEFRSLRSCSCSSFFLFSIHLFLRISLLNEFVWETCSCCCAQYQQDYLLVKEASRTSLVESIQNFLNVTERQGGFQSAPAGGESATPIASGQSSSIDSSTSTSTTTTTSTSTSTTVSTNNDGNVSALALACATERKYIKKRERGRSSDRLCSSILDRPGFARAFPSSCENRGAGATVGCVERSPTAAPDPRPGHRLDEEAEPGGGPESGRLYIGRCSSHRSYLSRGQ